MNNIFLREQLIRAMRRFFEQQHFHEVITPVLNRAIPTEPTIYPFTTMWHTQSGEQQFFLSTSPERGLKKMLAEGIGPCFAIGKSFRDLESAGPHHSPEFLMLEWYRPDATWRDIMSDVHNLLQFCASELKQEKRIGNWTELSLVNLLREHAHVNLANNLRDEELRTTAAQKGYQTKGATWEQLFNQIMLNEVEPHFPPNPFFLTDFPARISPLCAKNPKHPYLAERFEFFLNGVEIGNGNTENTNVAEVTAAFQAEKKDTPIDDEFLASLKKMHGHSCAGIGLGVDRLAMFFADVQDISEVEPFAIKS